VTQASLQCVFQQLLRVFVVYVCVCVCMCVFQHLMCAGLWCLVEGDKSCKTKLDPPLDGTECGADKVCVCVCVHLFVSREGPAKVNTVF
jgi:hypothetical protein